MINKKHTTYGYCDSRMQLVVSCQLDYCSSKGDGKKPIVPSISNQGYGFLIREHQISFIITLTFHFKSTNKSNKTVNAPFKRKTDLLFTK